MRTKLRSYRILKSFVARGDKRERENGRCGWMIEKTKRNLSEEDEEEIIIERRRRDKKGNMRKKKNVAVI